MSCNSSLKRVNTISTSESFGYNEVCLYLCKCSFAQNHFALSVHLITIIMISYCNLKMKLNAKTIYL